MRSPHVLVTGHTGFIGQNLVRRLDERGLPWVGASRSSGLDLSDPKSSGRLPAADWIVHLAGQTNILESWERPADYFRVNCQITLNVAEHARRTGARVLYLSSYMYGVPQRLPIDETHPPAARNPYAASKRICELLCESYASQFGVPCVVLRPFNVYGPGQSNKQLIPHIVAQALAGEEISLADSAPRRDWLWVGDLADALIRIVTASRSVAGYEIYNVGFGCSHSVQDVVDVVLAQLGPRRVTYRDEVRLNEIPDCVCDSRRLREAYGWKAATSLETGIRRMIEARKVKATP